jgi:hypothetical protein
VIADWLLLAGAVGLLVSLFLPWSHQFSRAFLAHWGPTGTLRGIPRNPTAWQVYSMVDVALAVLAVALVGVALIGGRMKRLIVLAASAVALAFVIHASGVPPTHGVAGLSGPVANAPASGPGETMAIAGLSVALVALAISFTAD